jgi:hypothetical protein
MSELRARRRFRAITVEIRKKVEALRASAKAAAPPGECRKPRQPNEHFKQKAYKLIRHYVQNGHEAVFANIVNEVPTSPTTRIKLEDNPFYWGLLAMAEPGVLYSVNQLRRIALGFLDAHKHDVGEEGLLWHLRKFKPSADR